MLRYFILLFLLVPVLELVILVKLYSLTSLGVTFGLILLTGLLGGFLAKRQGAKVLRDIRDSLKQGRLPATELIQGAMVIFAGALLLTPGLLTDLAGLLLLIPAVRTRVARRLENWAKKRFVATFHVQTATPFQQNDVIDVEGRVVDDANPQ